MAANKEECEAFGCEYKARNRKFLCFSATKAVVSENPRMMYASAYFLADHDALSDELKGDGRNAKPSRLRSKYEPQENPYDTAIMESL